MKKNRSPQLIRGAPDFSSASRYVTSGRARIRSVSSAGVGPSYGAEVISSTVSLNLHLKVFRVFTPGARLKPQTAVQEARPAYRPVDLARAYGISTQAVRNYER